MTGRGRLKTRYDRPGDDEPRWQPTEAEPEARPVPASPSESPGPEPSTAVVELTRPTEAPGPPFEIAQPRPEGGPLAATAEALEAAKPRPRVSAFGWMFGLAIAAFATGVVVFNSLVMPRLIHGIGEVRVPDVRSLTLEQAEQALRPLDLQVSRAGERFDPAVPRGFVLSQDPAPGTAVRGRKRVSVVVSLGEEFSSVPEVLDRKSVV